MTTDGLHEPRCATCATVLPRAGAICHVCDVESHFEGVLRASPPVMVRTRRTGTIHFGGAINEACESA